MCIRDRSVSNRLSRYSDSASAQHSNQYDNPYNKHWECSINLIAGEKLSNKIGAQCTNHQKVTMSKIDHANNPIDQMCIRDS